MTEFLDVQKIAKAQLGNGILQMTGTIVSAYVANNSVEPADLPDLITQTHAALKGLNQSQNQTAQNPAVPIKKSLTDDYIICLEDGQKFKSLKRHIMAHYNLTPEQYRQKWGLPADYPMICANYSKARSQLAKDMKLGRKPGQKIKKKDEKPELNVVNLNAQQ